MKKKHFYSMWAKTLTTAILLVAGGLTAVCAGWSVLGLYEGMNVQEIMNRFLMWTASRPNAMCDRKYIVSWTTLHLKIRF